MRIKTTDLVSVLFKIKNLIQTKRSKMGNLIGGEHDFLRAEHGIIHVALRC